MMSQTGVPALEVSNGFVRVGSLVRIKAGEAKGVRVFEQSRVNGIPPR